VRLIVFLQPVIEALSLAARGMKGNAQLIEERGKFLFRQFIVLIPFGENFALKCLFLFGRENGRGRVR
jgi:hypothetical protein